MKPFIHAKSSAKKFGGKPTDYLFLHDFMDSSKQIIGDNRHRIVWHNSNSIFILEKIFGHTFKNSDGKEISVREIAEQHCLEDFNGFIPTLQDYLMNMDYQPWMHGEGEPPSAVRLKKVNNLGKKFNWRKD